MRILTAIPVFNEEKHLLRVLGEVRRYADHILVVNDGSTDRTGVFLSEMTDLDVVTHPHNRGYGAAIRSAMDFAQEHRFDVLVTMDCDGQHEPARIPVLLEALAENVHVVSGSRYLRSFRQDDPPPVDRRRINHLVTAELNERFGLRLTDAFCGFKAYRVAALADLNITEPGWGMPLQLWVQAAYLGWNIHEVALPRLYLDPTRAFGGMLNDPEERLRYYHDVIDREAAKLYLCSMGGCR
jgi:dolichol-phosphate mannosyltransferase